LAYPIYFARYGFWPAPTKAGSTTAPLDIVGLEVLFKNNVASKYRKWPVLLYSIPKRKVRKIA
jgi:hypothetical protein